MEKPQIADNQPVEIELEAGKTYAWCQCGKSSKQPFCDGAHKGSSFSPNIFKVDTAKKVWLCMCKQTNGVPYCDGSHKDV